MLLRLFKASAQLDDWLQDRLGPTYRALLTGGLMIEVIRRIVELPHHLPHANQLLGTLLALALEIGLLIHQMGELSERFERRKAERARIRERKGKPPAAEP